jgi:hypothetical protein
MPISGSSDWDKGSEKEMLFYDKIDIVKGKISESNHKMVESTKMAGTATNGRGLYSYKLVGSISSTTMWTERKCWSATGSTRKKGMTKKITISLACRFLMKI